MAAGCQASKVTPPSGHVIVSERHTVSNDYWVPDAQDIQKTEAAIINLFSQAITRGKKQEYPLSEYVISYYGDVIDEKKVIVGHGYHKSRASTESLMKDDADPARTVRQVFGGGKLFFSFWYEIEHGKIENFYFNASK